MKRILGSVKMLQAYVHRAWYGPLTGALALLDVFIVFIPTDGIVVSSAMLTPRRWFWLAGWVTLGSTLGTLLLAFLVERHGLPWILHYYPGLDQTPTWTWTLDFFNRYGLLLVFAIAASPLMQQPAVILAALANTPLPVLAAVIFTGRLLKFGAIAWIASHAPRLLGRLWGVKDELKELGLDQK